MGKQDVRRMRREPDVGEEQVSITKTMRQGEKD